MVSQYGHTQCLRVLLEKHPKLVTKNKDGVSPMDVAYNKEILAVRAITLSPLLFASSFVQLEKREMNLAPALTCYFDFRSSKTTLIACRTSLLPSSRAPSTRPRRTGAVRVPPTWSTPQASRPALEVMAHPPRCLTRSPNLSAKIALHSYHSARQVGQAPRERPLQRNMLPPPLLCSISRTKRG